MLLNSNLTNNLRPFSLRSKRILLNDLGFCFTDDVTKDLYYYDAIYYSPIRSEILSENLMFVKEIDPYIVSILSRSSLKVKYYCYDDRIKCHRVMLLSSLYDGVIAPFGYLLICNYQDFKDAVNKLEAKMYG